MTRHALKAKAKQALGGKIFDSKWLYAVLAVFVCSAIIGAAGSVGIVVGGLIIMGPMTYGLEKMFLKASRDHEQMRLEDLFAGFNEDFSGTLLIGLMSDIFIFLWSLLFVIPGIIMTYAYSMAYFIKADHPEYGWQQCLSESKAMMKGHKWDLFVLDLSFLGWMILSSFCFGIGSLWVTAWQNAARAEFYNELSGYRPEIEQFN